MFEFYKQSLIGTPMIEPLCDEYRDLWKNCHEDKGKLVSLCLRQQSIPWFATMCCLGKGVTKEYLMKEYADYINGRTILQDCDGVKGYSYALYCGYDDACELSSDVSHFMWCNSTVGVCETKCPTIYISNGSDISLVCDGFNSIRVYIFDDSKLTIDDLPEDSNVTVYAYGSECNVVKGKYCIGTVKVHQKTLRL